jgi:Asp-tRNA(Asn)/Glu-tRNA(Gln) amidotransferase A subunit family amidase
MPIDPCDRRAVELRELLGRGQLRAQELMASCLERIQAVNPSVNAIVDLDAHSALAFAEAADEQRRRGDSLGALHGLPIGIKDLNDARGLKTTHGSPLYADNIAEHDEHLVANLRNAGGLIVAKTNTPEFGAGSNTTNAVYGPTRNPFDLCRTPGGSSGGAAVALATGMLPLCHGSDSGGSLRAPATWSGVASIRPSPGLVSSDRRGFPLSFFSVQGPMARNVEDVAFFLESMATCDPIDPLSPPARERFHPIEPVDLASLRVAVSTDLGCAPVDNGIRDDFMTRIEKIAGRFAEVRFVDPDFTSARDVFWTLRGLHFVANHAERYDTQREQLGNTVLTNTEAGLGLDVRTIAKAHTDWTTLYRGFQRFFADFDLMLCPGNAIPPFVIEEGIPREINGSALENYMDPSLVRSALTLTAHPVVALPCGLDYTGAPFGFQMVGPRHGDRFVLAAAHALEQVLESDPLLARPLPPICTGSEQLALAGVEPAR